MTYQQVLENARTCIGPYCKACNDCNGKVCRNTMPGPGAKGEGTGFIRNAEKWREICVNMDTICENSQVDTSFTLFGRTFEIRRSPRHWRDASSLRGQIRRSYIQ